MSRVASLTASPASDTAAAVAAASGAAAAGVAAACRVTKSLSSARKFAEEGTRCPPSWEWMVAPAKQSERRRDEAAATRSAEHPVLQRPGARRIAGSTVGCAARSRITRAAPVATSAVACSAGAEQLVVSFLLSESCRFLNPEFHRTVMRIHISPVESGTASASTLLAKRVV